MKRLTLLLILLLLIPIAPTFAQTCPASPTMAAVNPDTVTILLPSAVANTSMVMRVMNGGETDIRNFINFAIVPRSEWQATGAANCYAIPATRYTKQRPLKLNTSYRLFLWERTATNPNGPWTNTGRSWLLPPFTRTS